MWARVARFDGDPADIDARVERLRPVIDSGNLPPELEGAKFLLLVDRESGGMLGSDPVRERRGDAAGRRGDERRGWSRRQPFRGRFLRGASPHALGAVSSALRPGCREGRGSRGRTRRLSAIISSDVGRLDGRRRQGERLGAGSDSVRTKPSKPAGSVTSRKRASVGGDAERVRNVARPVDERAGRCRRSSRRRPRRSARLRVT